jgi:hypothetical protein
MDISRTILISLVIFTVNLPARAEGLCNANEAVIFNCELARSITSLCKSIKNGVLTYRNGIGTKINMQLSDEGKDKDSTFFLSSTPYAGGGESHIRFSQSSYSYYLYDKTVKTSEGPEFSAGIVIYKGKRKISNYACKNDASIRAAAYESMARESYQSIDSP